MREANFPIVPERKVSSMDKKPHTSPASRPAGSLSPQQTNKKAFSSSLHLGNTTPGVGSIDMLGAVWAPRTQKGAQGREEGPPRERDPVNERTQGAAMEPKSTWGHLRPRGRRKAARKESKLYEPRSVRSGLNIPYERPNNK